MSFQIHALPAESFNHLFELSDTQLQSQKALRKTVETDGVTPCRVSLQDAQIGEEVILLNYEHQNGDTPYQARHAIYVRKNAVEANPDVGQVPKLFNNRLISVRAFNNKHMLVNADAVQGEELEECIGRLFSMPSADYLHLHFALPGCYAARVTRA